MSTTAEAALINSVARQCQIIAGALITGVLIFYGIALAVDLEPGAPAQANAGPGAAAPQHDVPPLKTILTWCAVAIAVVGLPLSFLASRMIASQNRRAIAAGTWALPRRYELVEATFVSAEATRSDAGKLALGYMLQFLIGAALNEGVAFFAGVAYLIGKDPIALGAGFLLIGALVARFPTAHRLALWIARQEEMLFLERQAFA